MVQILDGLFDQEESLNNPLKNSKTVWDVEIWRQNLILCHLLNISNLSVVVFSVFFIFFWADFTQFTVAISDRFTAENSEGSQNKSSGEKTFQQKHCLTSIFLEIFVMAIWGLYILISFVKLTEFCLMWIAAIKQDLTWEVPQLLHDINIIHKLGITKFPTRKFSYERQNLVIKCQKHKGWSLKSTFWCHPVTASWYIWRTKINNNNYSS